MAYKIIYPGMKKYAKSRMPIRLQVVTTVFLLLFVVIVKWTWPQGWDVLASWLTGEV